MVKNLLLLTLLLVLSHFHSSAQNFVDRSKLAEGEIYKISIAKEGVFQIDYDFLNSTLDLNPSNINPANIIILSNGSGTLPLQNDAPRIDDLIQIPTISIGLKDGTFDSGDKLIFYSGGPDDIQIREDRVKKRKNPFDFNNHLFIHIAPDNKRNEVEYQSFEEESEVEISDYLQFMHHEQELINLQDYVIGNHGSGQTWYGEAFSVERKKEYSSVFSSIAPINPEKDINLAFSFAGRAQNGARFKIQVNDDSDMYFISRTELSSGETPVARTVTAAPSYNVNTIDNISLEYIENSNIDEGWLDYLTLSYFTLFPDLSSSAIVQNPESKGLSAKYILQASKPGLKILNVSNTKNIYGLAATVEAGTTSFKDTAHQETQRYALINTQASFAQPQYVEKVPNQNLHGLESPECLVVYHPDFEEAVDMWMEHRSNFSNMQIAKANIFEIYNEFGGGSQDPAAIRDFARMLYERDDSFHYLLLFGDGSFDYRYINKINPFANYVPVYETDHSLNPIYAFPTDDFYALLSRNEGGNLEGALDIAVGRLPADNQQEAMNLVEKIIRYDTDPNTLGDWRTRKVFLADDEDSNKHLYDANSIADRVRSNPLFNVEKIFFDAYPQVREAGGIRIPGASENLDESIYKGSLSVTYLGHGGPYGMAQERVLDISQIQSWTNKNKLPVFITATCTFAPYDDPTVFSAGKVLITKEGGGAIALFTTVRPVFATSNKRLTKAVHDQILDNLDNRELALGEILREAKNSNKDDTTDVNARKFALLGDPTLKLAIPEYDVVTTSINGNNAQTETDTAGPLAITHVSGYIADESGDIMTSFNGELTPTVFDKVESRKTLGQDAGSSELEYKVRDNVLWKGRVPVNNGEFSFTFVLPKSLDPALGMGKISYYAKMESQNIDAWGAYEGLMIGGYPQDSIENNAPPQVDLYLENSLFNSGDKVGPHPLLYAELSDDIGINLSTNSLGKEIKAVLDKNTSDPIILNSFFEPSLEDYRKGTIRYPLQNLEKGWHELTLRAWDVTDKYAESTIEFYVVDDENTTVEFSSYPNPFSDYTCFRLKTTLPPGTYDGVLQIMNTNGQMIEELKVSLEIEGSEMQCLEYRPGMSSKGIFPGVYFTRLKIFNPTDNMDIFTPVHKLVHIK